MKNAEILLQLVSAFYPPPDGCNHSLTLNGKGKVILTIVLGSGNSFLPVNFDEEDYSKSPQELAEAIKEHLSSLENLHPPKK